MEGVRGRDDKRERMKIRKVMLGGRGSTYIYFYSRPSYL